MEVLLGIVAVLLSLLFSYNTGKKVEKASNKEEVYDAIKSAEEARSKLSDGDYVDWLRKQRNK